MLRALRRTVIGAAATGTLLTAGLTLAAPAATAATAAPTTSNAQVSTSPASAPAATTPLPTAVYSKVSDWGSGFQAQYVLTNPMSVPLNTWSLQFSLPATEKITSMWGGTDTVGGTTHTVAAQSYDTTIAA